MSYLLEALKKAEQERAQVTDGEAVTAVAQSSKSSLPIWLPVVIISLFVVTVYKLFFSEAVDAVNNVEIAVSDVAVTDVAGKQQSKFSDTSGKKFQGQLTENAYQIKADEVLVEPVAQELEVEEASFVAEVGNANHFQKIETTTGNVTEYKPKQLAELSPSVLNRIPSLSLESHLYSSVAEYSSVVINGRSFSEGDYIRSDVIINKINSNGIVISVGEHLVELPKGISWVSTNYAK